MKRDPLQLPQLQTPRETRRFYIRLILLGIAAISFWRGIWQLSDYYIFPENLPLSCLVSIAIGVAIFIIYSEVRIMSP